MSSVDGNTAWWLLSGEEDFVLQLQGNVEEPVRVNTLPP